MCEMLLAAANIMSLVVLSSAVIIVSTPAVKVLIVSSLVMLTVIAVAPVIIKPLIIIPVPVVVIMVTYHIVVMINTVIPSCIKCYPAIPCAVIFVMHKRAWCAHFKTAGCSPVVITVKSGQVGCGYPPAAIFVIVTLFRYTVISIYIRQVKIIVVTVVVCRFHIFGRLLHYHYPCRYINRTYT